LENDAIVDQPVSAVAQTIEASATAEAEAQPASNLGQDDAITTVSSDATFSSSPHDPSSLFESTSVSVSIQPSASCSPAVFASEKSSTNHVEPVDTQTAEGGQTKPLQTLSAEPTLLVINGAGIEGAQMEEQAENAVNGHEEQSVPGDHLPEPPMSPVSNVHDDSSGVGLAGVKDQTPSRNRLSISYASGNRRLVIDADVVSSLKLFRQAGRVEVAVEVSKNNASGLKGILVSVNILKNMNRG